VKRSELYGVLFIVGVMHQNSTLDRRERRVRLVR
jgi:hypothetical protein